MSSGRQKSDPVVTESQGGKKSEESTNAARATGDGSVPSAKLSRKRTKTGCLTCRRRRIKCGEERPICTNCVKSKRQCEGYNQRVVFKDPSSAFRTGPDSTLSDVDAALPFELAGSSSEFLALPFEQGPTLITSTQAPLAPLAPLAPKPRTQNAVGTEVPLEYMPIGGNGSTAMSAKTDSGAASFPNLGFSSARDQRELTDGLRNSQGWANQGGIKADPLNPAPWQNDQVNESWNASWDPHSQANIPRNRHSYDSYIHPLHQYDHLATPIFREHANRGNEVPLKTEQEVLPIDSDDDIDNLSPGNEQDPSTEASPDPSALVKLQTQQSNHGVRSLTDFLNEPNVLATYRPSASTSPLMDPKTARIFWHFVTATAPSLSIFERHPANPSILFSGSPVPNAQRSLWTYTLPTFALSSPPLLQAMLACSCLHIARLQGGSILPSLKHYHMAIKRVAKYVSLPGRRNGIDVLAATLLLGYWEVMSAEHQKWNSHLLGARQLLIEANLAGRTAHYKAFWRKRRMKQGNPSHDQTYNLWGEGDVADDIPDFCWNGDSPSDRGNDTLVKAFTGYDPVYRNSELASQDDGIEWTGKDVEDFETRRDLFWWFAKQDVYQSIVSSNSLLLDYSRWTDCPPRAPMGRLEAPYGTYDHLMLLMGRLATFAAKDGKRKRKAFEASMARNTAKQDLSPGQNPQQSEMPQMPQMPQMYGMIPPTAPAEMPKAFRESYMSSPASSQEDIENEVAVAEAEAEWTSIMQALQIFQVNVGPEFQPLASEYQRPLATPFGPALFFKTYSIACVWQMYYTALIVLHRVHPSMPPAAMMAVGAAARQTGHFANEVGRITAGLTPTTSSGIISPSLAPALLESCLALFFAGVQYQNPAQRGWAVTYLRMVGEKTGWQSAFTIASGCEIAWERTGRMGKGPQYSRTVKDYPQDERIGHIQPDLAVPPQDNNDRRLIATNAGTRVHWAVGILGVEEDLSSLSLAD